MVDARFSQLYFLPTLTHAADRFGCDSWPTSKDRYNNFPGAVLFQWNMACRHKTLALTECSVRLHGQTQRTNARIEI